MNKLIVRPSAPQLARVALIAFALALAAPLALTMTAGTASSSGWIVASGADGSLDCQGGGTQDCAPDAS